jgi:hypothetical protein
MSRKSKGSEIVLEPPPEDAINVSIQPSIDDKKKQGRDGSNSSNFFENMVFQMLLLALIMMIPYSSQLFPIYQAQMMRPMPHTQ